MAIQTASFLKGKINNLVFYTRNGTHVARSVPALVKQSEATQQRSKNFGIASTAGKTLRNLLFPVHPFPKNRRMQVRFAGAIAQWLALNSVHTIAPKLSLPFISGFTFNYITSFAERCRLPLTVSDSAGGQLDVQIPAFVPAEVITAPAQTVMTELTITVAFCNLLSADVRGSSTQQMQIPYSNLLMPAQHFMFPMSAETGTLVVTAASLTYRLSNGAKEMRAAFLPSSIIDTRYC